MLGSPVDTKDALPDSIARSFYHRDRGHGKQSSRLTHHYLLGQRAQNPPHLLQRQGLQEAHTAQSHTIQSRKGPSSHPSTPNLHNHYLNQQHHTVLNTIADTRGPSNLLQALTKRTVITLRPRKAALRPQAIRLRRSDETSVPQEGQDDEEGGAEAGVHVVQDEGAAGVEAMQAF